MKVICSKQSCLHNSNGNCTLDTVILEPYPVEGQPAACVCSSDYEPDIEADARDQNENYPYSPEVFYDDF